MKRRGQRKCKKSQKVHKNYLMRIMKFGFIANSSIAFSEECNEVTACEVSFLKRNIYKIIEKSESHATD